MPFLLTMLCCAHSPYASPTAARIYGESTDWTQALTQHIDDAGSFTDTPRLIRHAHTRTHTIYTLTKHSLSAHLMQVRLLHVLVKRLHRLELALAQHADGAGDLLALGNHNVVVRLLWLRGCCR